MVVIRLSRGGAKKRPFYHLVVTDSRNRRDGRYIEQVGYFNPIARGQEKRLEIQVERINYWVSVGAQPSDRVHSLLKQWRKDPVKAAEAKPSSTNLVIEDVTMAQSEINTVPAKKSIAPAPKKSKPAVKKAESADKE